MNNMIYQKELQCYRDVDVLVVGAGPAGIGAAISAARNGARTLVFDQNGCVGGAATVGLVGPFMTSFDAHNEKMIIRGVFEELVKRMIAKGGAIDPAMVPGQHQWSGFYKIGHDHVGPFDRECLKQVATQMIIESGAELLLHTSFVDVVREEDTISGVVIANKSGMSFIHAKVVIDCTGDADVATRAGVGYILGNEHDGNIQPATLFFRVYNVDTPKLKAHIKEHADEIFPFYGPFSWLIREKKKEWGDIPRAEICLFEGPADGEYRLNVTRILNIDGTNAEDLTKAEIMGMEQAHKVFDFLKKYAAGFENARFMGTADMIGIRETRHIDGVYRLTADDVKACLVPDDSIAVLATNMDTHNKDDAGGTFYIHENGNYFGVPYRCLIPNSIDNLLVAGRSISTDAVAGSATRMIPCCIVFGQAAGTAAAMAAKTGIAPKEVNVQELREKIKTQGAYLGE
jgi:hypothetical protein